MDKEKYRLIIEVQKAGQKLIKKLGHDIKFVPSCDCEERGKKC